MLSKLTCPVHIHLKIERTVLPVKFGIITGHASYSSSLKVIELYRFAILPFSYGLHTIFGTLPVILPIGSNVIISNTNGCAQALGYRG